MNMEKITDTQRLNFVIQNGPTMDSEWRNGEYWIVYSLEVHGVYRKVVSVSDSYRSAIDKALIGDFKVVD